MKDGFIQQVGTPTEVFDMPVNLFVAEFIGAPKMNTFKTQLVREGDKYFVTPYGARIEVTGKKAGELLAKNVGNGAGLEDYRFFLKNNYIGGGYLNSLVERYNPTDAEIEYYFTRNEEAYNANGLTRELCTVDVRHILVYPEGADSSTIRTETFSEDAWAAGEAKANEIYELYLAGDLTEESFAALANEHSADGGSNTNGGLYTEVEQGRMVPEFDAWCFDPARKPGDTAVVKTSLGFHVMYFSGSRVLYPDYARQDMILEYQQNLVNEAVEKYPVEIDYSAIVLGYMDLMG